MNGLVELAGGSVAFGGTPNENKDGEGSLFRGAGVAIGALAGADDGCGAVKNGVVDSVAGVSLEGAAVEANSDGAGATDETGGAATVGVNENAGLLASGADGTRVSLTGALNGARTGGVPNSDDGNSTLPSCAAFAAWLGRAAADKVGGVIVTPGFEKLDEFAKNFGIAGATEEGAGVSSTDLL